MSLWGRAWNMLAFANIDSLSDSCSFEGVAHVFSASPFPGMPHQINNIEIFVPSSTKDEMRAQTSGLVAVQMHGYIQADPKVRLNQLSTLLPTATWDVIDTKL